MKLTIKALRSLIAESLEDLDERAMTTSDAGEDLALYVNQEFSLIDIVLYKKKEMDDEIAQGYGPKTLAKNVVANLRAYQSESAPFFEVGAVAAEKGWGPFVYDIAMSLIPDGIMPDRTSVSSDAKRIWEKYAQRSDVEAISLDGYNVKMHKDAVLNSAYKMNGQKPNINDLRSRHNSENSSNVSDAGRRFSATRM